MLFISNTKVLKAGDLAIDYPEKAPQGVFLRLTMLFVYLKYILIMRQEAKISV